MKRYLWIIPFLLLLAAPSQSATYHVMYRELDGQSVPITSKILHVCAGGGCRFSTVTAALAAITDATSTNPYIIYLHSGIYLESPLTWKSFVYLVGDGKDSTKVYCTGTCITISIPSGTDDCGFENVSIGGRVPIDVLTGTGAAGAAIEFENVELGHTDGSLGTNSDGACGSSPGCSVDCIVEHGGGYTYEFNNSVCRTAFDGIRINQNSTVRAVGSVFHAVTVTTGLTITPRIFSTAGTGGSFYLTGLQIFVTDTGTTGELNGMSIKGTATPGVGEAYLLEDVSFFIDESSGRTGTTRCLWFSAAGSGTSPVPVKLKNFTCQIKRQSSSGTVAALEIDASNHALWTIDVIGGMSDLNVCSAAKCTGSGTPCACCTGAGTGCGFTRNDIDNAETIAGFSLNVCNFQNGGIFTGTGTTTSCRQSCAIITDLASTDDNFEFWQPNQAVTLVGVGCRCRGTCTTAATFTLEDRGGNAMTITGTNPTCATTGNTTYAAMTTDTDNQLAAGEGVAFDVTNTPNPDGSDEYTICVTWI